MIIHHITVATTKKILATNILCIANLATKFLCVGEPDSRASDSFEVTGYI